MSQKGHQENNFSNKELRRFSEFLDGNRCFNRWIWIISFNSKIFIYKSEKVLFSRIYRHLWKWTRNMCKLFSYLIVVIMIYMYITKSMDEFSNFETACLCYHHGEKGIRCNIEWNSQKYIGRSLIKLTWEFSIRHIKLEKSMAWWRCRIFILDKLFYLSYIPSRNQITTRIRIICEGIQDILHLIDDIPFFGFPGTPLLAINWTKISPLNCKFCIYFYFFYEFLHCFIPFWRISRKFFILSSLF